MKKKASASKKSTSAKTKKFVKSVKKITAVKSIKKPSVKNSNVNDVLVKQLNTMIKDINEQGLKFLISQAQVILHNMKVVETIKDRKNTPDQIGITGLIPDKTKIEVKEAEDNSYFIIIISGARLFFSLEQMRKIVNICHSSGNEKEGSSRLHNWFKQNRKDVLDDAKIYGDTDQALDTIYKFIVSKYAVKK